MSNYRQRNLACVPFGSLLVGLVSLLALVPAKTRAAVKSEQVDTAIEKGIDYLRSKQEEDGSWEPPKPAPGAEAGAFAWGGETAIATCALLEAGISPREPSAKKAIDWLARADLHGTYAVGLRAQAWNLIYENFRRNDKAVLEARDRDRDFLLFSRIQRGPNVGFYSYAYGTALPAGAPGFAPIDPNGPKNLTAFDRSNSHFALLGASAVEHAGAEIPTEYWRDEDAAWKRAQRASGGWDYHTDDAGPTFTMTCAGVSALYITQSYLHRSDLHHFDTCAGNAPSAEIEKGLAWLDGHIGPYLDGHMAPNMYALYGIQRVGIANGRKFFGDFDWYKTGAELIVASQRPDGSWGSIHDTCFALLFLARGRMPMIIAKLQYELPNSNQSQPWNERPADIANLSEWYGRVVQCASKMNWETFRLSAPATAFQDAPVLYISGSEALEFNDKEIARLRTYVEEGGLIFGNADCGEKAFVAGFMKLGKAMFPKYDFRKLPKDHPIFDEMYHHAKWKHAIEVQAMSNGARELMLIAPSDDLGRAWQTESTRTSESYFQLAANIQLYATGKENLTHRGDCHVVRSHTPATHEIKVARIQAGDNWDPEPGAWRRLSAILHNDRQVDVNPEPVALGEGKLAGYKIAALTGTTALHLDPAQRQEIKQFVDNGGTLIVDSAGGGAEFADSAEAMLRETFAPAGARELAQPLPQRHPFYADLKLERVSYRSFARQFLVGGVHDPRLRGISAAGGRIGVFFSREDITAGLVGEEVDGINGYRPGVASQLMVGMVMYADKKR